MSTEPTALAPHVAPGWVDDLVLELRLRDVPGDVIGDTLAEVDAHVVDSGTPAHEAFGDPVAYAVQIAEHTRKVAPDDPRDMVAPAVSGVAFLGLLTAATGWFDERTATITLGTVAIAALLAVLPFVVQRFGTPILRLVVEQPLWRSTLLATVSTAPFVALGVLGRHVVLVSVPAVPLGAVALVALAATTVVVTRRTPVDPLVGPGQDPAQAAAQARRSTRRLAALTTTIQVVAVAAVLVVTVLVLR